MHSLRKTIRPCSSFACKDELWYLFLVRNGAGDYLILEVREAVSKTSVLPVGTLRTVLTLSLSLYATVGLPFSALILIVPASSSFSIVALLFWSCISMGDIRIATGEALVFS